MPVIPETMTGAQVGLVLQGGGALGAYELGVVRRLYEDFQPDIISGVSIGAITASALAAPRDGDPVGTLEKLWKRFVVTNPLMPGELSKFSALFGNPHFFRMRSDYYSFMSWTSFYDTQPVRETLLELIDFELFADPNHRPRLIVTATNVANGKIEPFDSKVTPITVEHVLASGSLPPGFPMTQIGENSYWDGGLFDNTPLGPVIEAFDASAETEKHLFVANLFPITGNHKICSTVLAAYSRLSLPTRSRAM